MKKSACLIILLLAMVLSLFFSAVNCWANEKLYKMTGSVAAIDREHNTVVVEVPMVGKTFTVGGPPRGGTSSCRSSQNDPAKERTEANNENYFDWGTIAGLDSWGGFRELASIRTIVTRETAFVERGKSSWSGGKRSEPFPVG